MQSGDLRNKVGFYKRSAVDPGSPPAPDYGNTEGDFPAEPEFTCAANIKPRLGGEAVLAQRLTGTNLVNVTVRQSIDTRLVGVEWHIKDERSDEMFNIRSIIDPNEHTVRHGRFFEMLCEKGAAT